MTTALVTYHTPLQQGAAQLQRYITARLGDIRLAIPLSAVAWAMPAETPVAIPHAPAEIRGLLYRRGELVTVMNLRHRLALADEHLQNEAMYLVLHQDAEKIALPVDEIGEITLLDMAQKQRLPQRTEPWQQWVTGMVLHPSGLLMLLDVAALLTAPSPQ